MITDNKISLNHIVSFGDAVFAFAITIMALSIDVPSFPPNLPESQVLSELLKILPQLGIYFISYIVIGIFWIKYHVVFNQIKNSHSIIVWLNLLFLFMITLVSFGTALHMENSDYHTVFVVYTIILVATGLLLSLIWIYADRKKLLLDYNINKKQRQLYYIRNSIPTIVFTSSIGISYIDMYTAQMFWIAIFPLQILLTRSIKKAQV